MNSQTLANWIQIFTGIALLLGLFLVVLELQQNQDLARVQLSSEGFLSYQDSRLNFLGESFAETYAKACFQPTSLTDAELVQMHAYHDAQLAMVGRAQIYADIGTDRFSWNQIARGRVRDWLSTKVGRAGYKNGKDKGALASWIVPVAEDLISSGDLYDCAESYGYFDIVRSQQDVVLE